ncbi:twin-arginine translocation signal domain-containing protein [Roseibium sp.]|uniref:twin-arginine translocation signal domain-containing protein n=1 Tax=Roseibium sp. TaxID=1936156 RepID=UPI003D09E95D
MKKTETARPDDGTDRRNFLKLAAISAPVAVTTVAAGTAAEAAVPDPSSSKMQDTAHTRAYYDSARF